MKLEFSLCNVSLSKKEREESEESKAYKRRKLKSGKVL